MSGSAVILARGCYVNRDEALVRGLKGMVRSLVEDINTAAGEALLYLTEYAGLWFLYGRPSKEDADRLLMHGCADVEGFARLVVRLEEGIRTSDAHPYENKEVRV